MPTTIAPTTAAPTTAAPTTAAPTTAAPTTAAPTTTSTTLPPVTTTPIPIPYDACRREKEERDYLNYLKPILDKQLEDWNSKENDLTKYREKWLAVRDIGYALDGYKQNQDNPKYDTMMGKKDWEIKQRNTIQDDLNYEKKKKNPNLDQINNLELQLYITNEQIKKYKEIQAYKDIYVYCINPGGPNCAKKDPSGKMKDELLKILYEYSIKKNEANTKITELSIAAMNAEDQYKLTKKNYDDTEQKILKFEKECKQQTADNAVKKLQAWSDMVKKLLKQPQYPK